MNHRPALILIPLTLAVSAVDAAEPLDDFAELREVLFTGGEVRVVADYAACEMLLDGEPVGPGPEAVGGLTIEAFEYFAPGVVGNELGYLSFSHSQLIAHRDYVLNYVRFRVYEDGAVEVTARYLDPQNHEVLMDEGFTARLGEAVVFYHDD
ncbi:MAG: hypothetical protein GF403_11415 [Candidatus Coatesbacteria bacterium]|nr:hypothetical protein [Candidatus Coatesbacteria bacterium]